MWAAKHFRPYLYGHPCTEYTDHEALKSLLNTPQPSGKLARWGMALQEMDLTIQHCSGKHNLNADALSCFPQAHPATEETPSEGVVASITAGDGDLAMCQREDEGLKVIVTYLETGVQPEDKQTAKRLALTQSQYVVEDGVLYWAASDSTLSVIPPTPMRESLFREAHCGRFGAHLGDSKVHMSSARIMGRDAVRHHSLEPSMFGLCHT